MPDETGVIDVEYAPRTFDSATTAEERLAGGRGEVRGRFLQV
jgi:hypothetical protein